MERGFLFPLIPSLPFTLVRVESVAGKRSTVGPPRASTSPPRWTMATSLPEQKEGGRGREGGKDGGRGMWNRPGRVMCGMTTSSDRWYTVVATC